MSKKTIDSMPLSTRIKNGLNAVLGMIGLEISTTRLRIAREKLLEELEKRDHWDTPKYSAGYKFKDENYLQFIIELKSKYADNYKQFHLHDSPHFLPSEYFLQNGYFEAIDAHVAYGIVRDYQPSSIIEVGSGHSTKVLRLALNDNQQLSQLISIDPNPRTDISEIVDESIPSQVELLETSYIVDRLNVGDILFIDSSHYATMGSDVIFLFLQVLPQLKSGTLIHIHDIFLPYDYPKKFLPYMWSEQYLLHAFLYLNPELEILWPSYHIWMTHKKTMTDLFDHAELCQPPSSLWLKKL